MHTSLTSPLLKELTPDTLTYFLVEFLSNELSPSVKSEPEDLNVDISTELDESKSVGRVLKVVANNFDRL